MPRISDAGLITDKPVYTIEQVVWLLNKHNGSISAVVRHTGLDRQMIIRRLKAAGYRRVTRYEKKAESDGKA